MTKAAVWATAVLVSLGILGLVLRWPSAVLCALAALLGFVLWMRGVCKDRAKAVGGRDRF